MTLDAIWFVLFWKVFFLPLYLFSKTNNWRYSVFFGLFYTFFYFYIKLNTFVDFPYMFVSDFLKRLVKLIKRMVLKFPKHWNYISIFNYHLLPPTNHNCRWTGESLTMTSLSGSSHYLHILSFRVSMCALISTLDTLLPFFLFCKL